MMYFGQIGRLKPDKIEEYRTLHAAAWPGVLRTIQNCHLHRYSIFLEGDTVFSYFEYDGENYEADMSNGQIGWIIVEAMLIVDRKSVV